MKENEKIRIAIADDHMLLRKGLADLIDSFGPFRVITQAGSGVELMKQLNSDEVLPHICILDINMPELDGFGTLAQIRKKWPAMKVLALSMYNNEFTIIRMLRSGANGYLLKNCHPNEFKHALEHIYNYGFYETGIAEKNKSSNEPVSITPKELEFLKLCCSELVYKEIADKMGISPRTVEDYRDNLFKKLKLSTRTGLVIYALRCGIVSLDM
jgi:DNA-binding NarL/FixJ family response regulator